MQDLEHILKNAMRDALEVAAMVATDHIRTITPRDTETPRLPQNINRKDGKRPQRHPPSVNIGGNWYAGVTGNLKRSIGYHLDPSGLSAEVGVVKHGPAQAYAEFLELGTPTMPARPFVSLTMEDPHIQAKMTKKAQDAFNRTLQKNF